MSSFEGALIREQGQTFAVVIVKHHHTSSTSAANAAREAFQPHFPGVPVVLASQDARGTFRYHGRPDLAKFLAGLHPSQIPWKKYNY
ncbi:hypothetical protein PUP49_18535 [Pseudomonas chlororaphis]|uniref:hypothetical protein n=1 Tax=Pseudomonas chlororaphis TaxID=587753 RepID=UPI0009BB23F1|nr:hypothetical protein [Pseudomonas chlororaphis]WDG89304.1 hypothetical protein PUP49_18535 [Pseudomonas chlororaphis]